MEIIINKEKEKKGIVMQRKKNVDKLFFTNEDLCHLF